MSQLPLSTPRNRLRPRPGQGLPGAVLAGLLIFTAGFSRAETLPADAPRPHPVEIKVQALLKGAVTTVDMREALGKAHVLWDAEMNRAYQALRKALPAPAGEKLKAAQQQWLVFRDAEFAAQDAQYQQFGGTIFLIHQDSARLAVVEQRARALGAMLDLQLTGGG